LNAVALARPATRDQLLERRTRQTLCLRIFKQLIAVVKSHGNAHHLVGELLRIDAFAELLLFDSRPHDAGDGLLPSRHLFYQQVSHGTWPIIKFLGKGHEHAAASPVTAANPIEVTVKECSNARLAPRRGQGRYDYRFREAGGNLSQYFELKFLFRTEVREKTALRAVEGGGQNAQGQTLEANLVGDGEGAVDDSLMGVEVSFHGRIIIRPVGRVNAEFSEMRGP